MADSEITRLCACGCGQWTTRRLRPNRMRRIVAGQANVFIKGHNGWRGDRLHCRRGHVRADYPRTKSGGCGACQRINVRAHKRRKTLRQYGMTEEQFDALERAQAGRCAICDRIPPLRHKSRTLHIDHDHATGKFRGLICSLCNTVLGKMDDSPRLLRLAADYLESHR
jgi:hypothetical protein